MSQPLHYTVGSLAAFCHREPNPDLSSPERFGVWPMGTREPSLVTCHACLQLMASVTEAILLHCEHCTGTGRIQGQLYRGGPFHWMSCPSCAGAGRAAP